MVIPALILLAVFADIRGCVCDPARAETMAARECALAKLSADDRSDKSVLFLPDANPTKPNRTLAIPHVFRRTLNDMSADERTSYLRAAIEKARALWPDHWGLAVNGEERRSQCLLHVHIGKLLEETDRSGGVLVDRVEDVPLPPPGTGLLIIPEGEKLRVETGAQVYETALMR